MKIEDMPEFMTVKQVAKLMGVHTNTVYIWCTSGELPSLKSGNTRRIRKSAYIEWIESLERPS